MRNKRFLLLPGALLAAVLVLPLPPATAQAGGAGAGAPMGGMARGRTDAVMTYGYNEDEARRLGLTARQIEILRHISQRSGQPFGRLARRVVMGEHISVLARDWNVPVSPSGYGSWGRAWTGSDTPGDGGATRDRDRMRDDRMRRDGTGAGGAGSGPGGSGGGTR